MTRKNHQKTKKGRRKYAIMRQLAGDVRRVDDHNFLDIDGLHYTLRGNKSGSFDLYVGMVGDEVKPYHLNVEPSDLGGAVRRLTDLKAEEWGIFPDTTYVHPVLQELGMRPVTKIIHDYESETEESESKAKETVPSRSSGFLKYAFGVAASLAAVVLTAYALSGSPKIEEKGDPLLNCTITNYPIEPRQDLDIFGVR